jgi:hypothetical protein
MARFPLDTDEEPERKPPQTESTKERGFGDEDAPEDLGRTDDLDDLEDLDSDIADEGPGHRG